MSEDPASTPSAEQDPARADQVRRELPHGDAVQDALDLLEPWSTAPGSVEIFDAVYGLREDPAGWSALEQAAARWPKHPALEEVLAVLGQVALPEPPDLAVVLAEDGPLPADGDLVGEVVRRRDRAAEVRRILEARVELLEAERDQARRTANGVAFVGAVLAVFALLGWAAALGWWEIRWLEPPAPPEPGGIEAAEPVEAVRG